MVSSDIALKSMKTYSDKARRQKDRSQHRNELHVFAILLRGPRNTGLNPYVPLPNEAVKL